MLLDLAQAFVIILAKDLLYSVILLVSIFRILKYDKREFVSFAAFFLMGVVVFILYQAPLQAIALLTIGMLLFNGLLEHTKDSRLALLYVIMGIAYILFTYTIGIVFIAQAMLFGMLGGISSLKEPKFRMSTKKIEIDRDLVHISAGLFLMLCFIYLSIGVARLILMLTIMSGLLVIRHSELNKRNRLAKVVYVLERSGARLGHGAQWLALGSLLSVSFLQNTGTLIVFTAIFIGDPLATIAGTTFRGPRLPYNRSKSYIGTAVYFISTSLVAYLFIGIWSILIALIAAAVESIDFGMDDNFTVSLALTAVLFAAKLVAH